MASGILGADPGATSDAIGRAKLAKVAKQETPNNFGYEAGSPAVHPGLGRDAARFAGQVFETAGIRGPFGQATTAPEHKDYFQNFANQFLNFPVT